MTSASPIIPSERIVTIDILRGIALFIVLVINAATEFRVSIFEQLLPGTPAATTADKLADGFVLALSTKGFILFSFLFGLGLAIQFDRFAGKSDRLALMLRRLTVLLAIGLVHLLLIWNGDILTEYAMVGFAVLPFLYGPRWLLGITAAVSMAFFLATPLLPPIMPFPDSTWISQHVEQARGVYGSGSFMQILAFRIEEVRYILPFHANAMPRTFGLFLCGALVWRTGFFRRPLSRTPVILAACFSLAIGAWMTMGSTNGEAFGWSLNWRGRYIVLSLSQLILAAGYALLIVAVTDSAVGKRLLGPAGALGRMAFTNYLAQSVILSCMFYSFGFALFGRLSIAQTIAIAIVIYAAQAASSSWWLRRFRFGPVEWLWRSLTYGEWQRASRAKCSS
jgi:uncharacterized protein